MGWPNPYDVDLYVDYNNGLFDYKKNMIYDYVNTKSIQKQFPKIEDYAGHLEDEFDRMFWENQTGEKRYKQEVQPTPTPPKHPLKKMSEEEKAIVNQLL